MDHWQDSPTPKNSIPNYQIYRTPSNQRFRAICISEGHVGAKLHFYKGRTSPCNGAACEPCQQGHAARWKGYLLCKQPDNPKVVIFEFTERGYQATIDKFHKHGSLRGCVFLAQRLNRKPNGPLLLEWEDNRFDESQLPYPADLRAMLARMWEVRTAAPRLHDEDHYEETDPRRHFA